MARLRGFQVGHGGGVDGGEAAEAVGGQAGAEEVVQRTRHSTPLRVGARAGLLTRAVFYLILAYLAAAVAGRVGHP